MPYPVPPSDSTQADFYIVLLASSLVLLIVVIPIIFEKMVVGIMAILKSKLFTLGVYTCMKSNQSIINQLDFSM